MAHDRKDPPSTDYLNVKSDDPDDDTPLVGTDQYEDEPNNWLYQTPHHPHERGILGTIVRRLRAALSGPQRGSPASRPSY